MDVQFKETKPINLLGASYGRTGSFAVDKSPIRFENCRERFATHWSSRTKAIFFRHDKSGESVARFILKTEQILKEEVHSEFALTTNTQVVWLAPSKFWMRCKMRRSLFTILLRAGIEYEASKDNYEEALFNNTYANGTRDAVMRFLFGFTKYTGPLPNGSSTLESNGWSALLRKQRRDVIKDYLKSPKRKPYQPTFDLKEEIWI